MNSYARLPRVTDQLTGREGRGGRGEEGIIQTAVPMPPHPPYMAVVPTTVVGVDAEATATALDMVGIFKIKYKINIYAAIYCVKILVARNQKHYSAGVWTKRKIQQCPSMSASILTFLVAVSLSFCASA